MYIKRNAPIEVNEAQKKIEYPVQFKNKHFILKNLVRQQYKLLQFHLNIVVLI